MGGCLLCNYIGEETTLLLLVCHFYCFVWVLFYIKNNNNSTASKSCLTNRPGKILCFNNDLLLIITELSVVPHVEVKSYVIGYVWSLLSNQRSAHCYQEAAGSYLVAVLCKTQPLSALWSRVNRTIKPILE